jgi:hypothetical protein
MPDEQQEFPMELEPPPNEPDWRKLYIDAGKVFRPTLP